MDLSKLGAFVTKSITREERAGNEPARIVETRAGMLNAIGLANVGLDRFLNEKVPLLQKMPCPVIVNVAGHSFDDYTETCAAMDGLDCVAGVELNVSCPNVKRRPDLRHASRPAEGADGGGEEGAAAQAADREALAQRRGHHADRPGRRSKAGRTCSRWSTPSPRWRSTSTSAARAWRTSPAAFPGPAIKPIALHLVSRVYRNVAKSGRRADHRHGRHADLAGRRRVHPRRRSAVGIGTALFVDPATPNKICDGLSDYMEKEKVERISDLVGALELPGDEPREDAVGVEEVGYQAPDRPLTVSGALLPATRSVTVASSGRPLGFSPAARCPNHPNRADDFLR